MSLERFTRKEVAVARLDTPVCEVAALMQERHVGAVVIAEDERPVGIVTDRDLTLRVVAARMSPDTPVSVAMSREVIVRPAQTRLDDALFTMRTHGIRRLPIVTAEGTLAGMVALDDLLVLLAGELSSTAEVVVDNRGP